MVRGGSFDSRKQGFGKSPTPKDAIDFSSEMPTPLNSHTEFLNSIA